MAATLANGHETVTAAPPIRPLDGRYVCQRLSSERTTRGGIVIPDVAQERSRFVTVVCAPREGQPFDNGTRRPVLAKPGDTVLTGKHGGVEFTYDGEVYLLLAPDEVFAIIGK